MARRSLVYIILNERFISIQTENAIEPQNENMEARGGGEDGYGRVETRMIEGERESRATSPSVTTHRFPLVFEL